MRRIVGAVCQFSAVGHLWKIVKNARFYSLGCTDYCADHPAEARKIMDEMEEMMAKCIDCVHCNKENLLCHPKSQDCRAEYKLDESDLRTDERCDFFYKRDEMEGMK